MTPALALALSLLASLAAWGAGTLSGSGALAAGAVGFEVLWATGWEGGAVLLAFFLPSTLVGRLASRRGSVSDARGERRDAIQVLANGAAGALGAGLERLTPGLGYWVLSCACAGAAADTWATALGAWSRREPRLLLAGQRVPRGTSGAVSPLGTLGALLGATLVAGVAALGRRDAILLPLALGAGFAGMLLDSLLGATLQARFRCPACAESSERRRHRCGSRTELVGGWRWLDNDGVNAVATGAGAAAGALLWLVR